MTGAVSVKRVLMCPPTFYKIAYNINPWMAGQVVDTHLAMKQWTTLKKTVESLGIRVEELTPVDGLPDMVFCCDAGIVYQNKVYLSHFREKERQEERQHYEKWFRKNSFEVCGDESLFFEGGGDASFNSDSTFLFGGYGFRSDLSVYDQIQHAFGGSRNFKVLPLQLVDRRFFNLGSCFRPLLNNDLVLWFPNAFAEACQAKLRCAVRELIAVPEREMRTLICSSLVLTETDKKPILLCPAGAEQTKYALRSCGFELLEHDLSEFLKSGGACQSLMMKLY